MAIEEALAWYETPPVPTEPEESFGTEAVSSTGATAEEAATAEEEIRPESWRMTLTDWKKRVEELRAARDEEALRAIGGLGSDYAHRFRVKQALADGKPVPPEVLADYPGLGQE